MPYIKASFFLILFILTMRIFLSECAFEVRSNAAIVTAPVLSSPAFILYTADETLQLWPLLPWNPTWKKADAGL